MDKKTTLEMIAAISDANGTSGFEDEVVAAIRPYAEGLGEITEDHMRNLYIRRKENNGKRPVVQLDAHSDEVGFMVQAICPNGTLRIILVGSTTTFRHIRSGFVTNLENISRVLPLASRLIL